MNIHESAEDYLEMMLMLQQKKGYIKSVDIARELNVTKPSVSYAVKNLRNDGYITMERSGEIHLTDKGMSIARDILSRHELLSSLFIALGISKENAVADACKIEHDLSEETILALKKHFQQYLEKAAAQNNKE